MPKPRPGTCVQDTRQLPDTVLNFIRKHPMMNRNIPHDAAGPAFYQRDVTFTKIVVDNEVTISHFGGKSQDYTIYFAGKCVLFTKYLCLYLLQVPKCFEPKI